MREKGKEEKITNKCHNVWKKKCWKEKEEKDYYYRYKTKIFIIYRLYRRLPNTVIYLIRTKSTYANTILSLMLYIYIYKFVCNLQILLNKNHVCNWKTCNL